MYTLRKSFDFPNKRQEDAFLSVVKTFCKVTVNDLRVTIEGSLSFILWRKITDLAKALSAQIPGKSFPAAANIDDNRSA